jgi:hypothetical protein
MIISLVLHSSMAPVAAQPSSYMILDLRYSIKSMLRPWPRVAHATLAGIPSSRLGLDARRRSRTALTRSLYSILSRCAAAIRVRSLMYVSKSFVLSELFPRAFCPLLEYSVLPFSDSRR